MTKDEIKSLVAAKIAGQGTNVDAASVLPSIIEGILDLIPEAPVQPDISVIDPTDPSYIKCPVFSESSVAQPLTQEQFNEIMRSPYIRSSAARGSVYMQQAVSSDFLDILLTFVPGATVDYFYGTYLCDAGEYTRIEGFVISYKSQQRYIQFVEL